MTAHPKLYVFSAHGAAPLQALAATHRLSWHGLHMAGGWFGVIYPGSHLCKSCLVSAGVQVFSPFNPSPLSAAMITLLQVVAPTIASGDTCWSAAEKIAALGAGYEFFDPEV